MPRLRGDIHDRGRERDGTRVVAAERIGVSMAERDRLRRHRADAANLEGGARREQQETRTEEAERE